MATYKILTLNAAFLPRTPISPNLPDYDLRADMIADRVKEMKVDILVLNEVFVPEIRQRLVRALETEYSIPAGLDTGFFNDSLDVIPTLRDDRPIVRSARSAARMTMRSIDENETLTTRERNLAIARAAADVPFVDSGLFFAIRRNRGILTGGVPGFIPWQRRGVESISARMGYFHISLGLQGVESRGAYLMSITLSGSRQLSCPV